MASIGKTKTGYRAQVYVLGVRESRVFRTRREAVSWAAARETEIRDDAAKRPGDKYTLGQAMARYAEEVTPTKRGARWEAIRLAGLLRDPALPCGELVGKITPEHLGEWRDSRLKQVSPGTVLREFGLITSVLETARREWRWIESNPARDVRKPSAPDHREVVITPRQVRAMLSALGYRHFGRVDTFSKSVAVCFLVALRTGMRAGELCGLTWDRVHDGYCSTPHKTGRTAQSLRDVPLQYKAVRLIERMRGWDDTLVFGLKSHTLDAMFRKYRKRAGLEGFTFHDARHTAATMLSRKLDVLDLCKAFGWADPKMAMTYYNPTASDIAKRMR
jgi:integrase